MNPNEMRNLHTLTIQDVAMPVFIALSIQISLSDSISHLEGCH